MKYPIKYTALITVLLCFALFSGCKKDFLEINPKGKLIAKTVTDYDRALNSLKYVNIVTTWGGGAAQAVMGDEVAAMEPYFSGSDLRTQRLFKWEGEIYKPDEDAVELDVPMTSLYAYNKIINEVMEATGGDDAKKKAIMAEAKVGRAWIYFLLINYYGKPYNESTSSTDPGFPLITAADATQTKFQRATVKEVYDFIISDLTTAMPDLPVAITNRLRMARPTAEGLLGKVYVFMGRYQDALPLLNAALDDVASATIPVRLYDYNTGFAPGGIFLPVGMFGPSTPSFVDNEENLLARQFSNFWTFINNEIALTAQTVALFDKADLRLKFYSADAFGGGPYPNGMRRKIGPGTSQIGVVLPDLYLLQAECKARINDLAGAVHSVETLRKNRMPAKEATVPATIASSQQALVRFILEERIREFALAGYRWFDMRRLSVDPDYKNTVKTTHQLFAEDGAVTDTYMLTPDRYTLRFPEKLMRQNPGIDNNP